MGRPHRAAERWQVVGAHRLADDEVTKRWHAHRPSSGSGHVYQGRFKSFPIQEYDHFCTVARYAERNEFLKVWVVSNQPVVSEVAPQPLRELMRCSQARA